MAKKVADQLVEMLVEAGVKRIYAVTGDSLNPVNDAIRRDGRIQWIHVRHEEAGAYAAKADAQMAGIGCCAGSSGPGHVHLVNGLYDAHRERAPVIAIASTIFTDKLGIENFQETNPQKLFDDCSSYCHMANTPKQFATMMQTALQNSLSGNGVSVVGLPGDVANDDASDIVSSTEVYKPQASLHPSAEQTDQLVNLINENKKICLFAGMGAKDAREDLVTLAQKLKAPVAYTYRAKMEIQKDNPNEIGMTGLLGLKSAYEAMHDADLLIMLGTDFPYSSFLPEKVTTVQVERRAERIGRRAKVGLGIQGDVEPTIEALLKNVDEKEDGAYQTKHCEIYGEVKKRLQTHVKAKGNADRIQPEYVAALINDIADDDAIFTVDTGMSAVWASKYLHAKSGRSMLGSFNHGSMANAMPMAIGAALAQPDRQTVAFCGDGGISMLLGDVATISQYQLPIKLVVFNNRSLGMVKLEMNVAGYEDWQTDMHNPDFATLAESMNIKGITARKPDEVESALDELFNTEGPALLSVFTDDEALAMPPRLDFDQVKGYSKFMSKKLMDGDFDEILQLVKKDLGYLKDSL